VSDDETGAITNPTDLITYNLGGTVFDNRGNASYAGKLNDEIETATGVTPVTAHVVKTVSGKTYGDYDDGSYRYTLSVDRNNYNYNYDGRVILNADGLYDNSTSSFVSKSLEKSDSSGNYASSTDTNFHRGDLIRLSYVSKWDGAENANHYFQSYTVSTVVDGDGNSAGRTVTHCVSSGNTAYEKSGSFELQFESDGISVTAYFIAEVYVTYGRNHVLQTDGYLGEYGYYRRGYVCERHVQAERYARIRVLQIFRRLYVGCGSRGFARRSRRVLRRDFGKERHGFVPRD
jgi:hypothetical protein